MFSKKKDPFKDPQIINHKETGIDLPLRYYRAAAIFSYFEVQLDPLKDMISCQRLHPIKKSSKTGIICFINTFCQHSSIEEFSTFTIAIPVTMAKKPAPAQLPFLFEQSWPNNGLFVYREGVSNSTIYDVSNKVWGYQSFLADIDTSKRDETYQETIVSEEEHILTLINKHPEYTKEEEWDIPLFSIKNNQILETIWRIRGSVERSNEPESSMVILGEHPLISTFKTELKISPKSFHTRYFINLKAQKSLPERILSVLA